MRKYIADCNSLVESNKTISIQDACNKYVILSKIINLEQNNPMNNNIQNIINTCYKPIYEASINNTQIMNPILKIMGLKAIKNMSIDEFQSNFSSCITVIVNNLLREQCAFISEYSPSNKNNEAVVNLFIIAWHVVIKFAYETCHQDLAKKLLEFFSSDKNCGIRINCEWIGIPELDHNTNNNMINNINNISNNIKQFNNNNMQSNMNLNMNKNMPNNINNNRFNTMNNVNNHNMLQSNNNHIGMNNMNMKMNNINMGQFSTNNNFRNNNMNNF